MEATPERLLSERTKQFDLSAADWGGPGGALGAGAPGSPSKGKGGGKLGRLKRSASISVVENLMQRGEKTATLKG